KRSCVWVNGRQTRQMLANLLQIGQIGSLFLHHRAHSSESCAFELFASEERVSVFEQAHVVLSKSIDVMATMIHLSEGEFVMVAIVQHVDQIFVERVDFL